MMNPKGKKRILDEFNTRLLEYWQEKIFKNSDISYKFVSNMKARRILGSGCLLPSYLQQITLDAMEVKGLINRCSQQNIENKKQKCQEKIIEQVPIKDVF